jgi:hypothetical protein
MHELRKESCYKTHGISSQVGGLRGILEILFHSLRGQVVVLFWQLIFIGPLRLKLCQPSCSPSATIVVLFRAQLRKVMAAKMALQLYFGPSFGADKAARQNGRDGGSMHAVVRAECMRPQLQKEYTYRSNGCASQIVSTSTQAIVWRLIPYMWKSFCRHASYSSLPLGLYFDWLNLINFMAEMSLPF